MENTMGVGQADKLLGITVKSNQKRLSPEQEKVQDLATIVHCFSSRLYGLRNYRRQLQAALESDHAAGTPDQAGPVI